MGSPADLIEDFTNLHDLPLSPSESISHEQQYRRDWAKFVDARTSASSDPARSDTDTAMRVRDFLLLDEVMAKVSSAGHVVGRTRGRKQLLPQTLSRRNDYKHSPRLGQQGKKCDLDLVARAGHARSPNVNQFHVANTASTPIPFAQEVLSGTPPYPPDGGVFCCDNAVNCTCTLHENVKPSPTQTSFCSSQEEKNEANVETDLLQGIITPLLRSTLKDVGPECFEAVVSSGCHNKIYDIAGQVAVSCAVPKHLQTPEDYGVKETPVDPASNGEKVVMVDNADCGAILEQIGLPSHSPPTSRSWTEDRVLGCTRNAVQSDGTIQSCKNASEKIDAVVAVSVEKNLADQCAVSPESDSRIPNRATSMDIDGDSECTKWARKNEGSASLRHSTGPHLQHPVIPGIPTALTSPRSPPQESTLPEATRCVQHCLPTQRERTQDREDSSTDPVTNRVGGESFSAEIKYKEQGSTLQLPTIERVTEEGQRWTSRGDSERQIRDAFGISLSPESILSVDLGALNLNCGLDPSRNGMDPLQKEGQPSYSDSSTPSAWVCGAVSSCVDRHKEQSTPERRLGINGQSSSHDDMGPVTRRQMDDVNLDTTLLDWGYTSQVSEGTADKDKEDQSERDGLFSDDSTEGSTTSIESPEVVCRSSGYDLHDNADCSLSSAHGYSPPTNMAETRLPLRQRTNIETTFDAPTSPHIEDDDFCCAEPMSQLKITDGDAPLSSAKGDNDDADDDALWETRVSPLSSAVFTDVKVGGEQGLTLVASNERDVQKCVTAAGTSFSKDLSAQSGKGKHCNSKKESEQSLQHLLPSTLKVQTGVGGQVRASTGGRGIPEVAPVIKSDPDVKYKQHQEVPRIFNTGTKIKEEVDGGVEATRPTAKDGKGLRGQSEESSAGFYQPLQMVHSKGKGGVHSADFTATQRSTLKWMSLRDRGEEVSSQKQLGRKSTPPSVICGGVMGHMVHEESAKCLLAFLQGEVEASPTERYTRLVREHPDTGLPQGATLIVTQGKPTMEDWATNLRGVAGLSVLSYNMPLKERRTMSSHQVASFDVVLTTYDILRAKEVLAEVEQDTGVAGTWKRNLKRSAKKSHSPVEMLSLLHGVWWHRIVADHAHILINRKSVRTGAMMLLKGRARWCILAKEDMGIIECDSDRMRTITDFLQVPTATPLVRAAQNVFYSERPREMAPISPWRGTPCKDS